MGKKLFGAIPAALFVILLHSNVASAQYEIFVAANRGDLRSVETILRREPALASSKSRGGFTPLHMAAINGHAAICEVLIEKGASINERNLDGATPLIKAVQGNHPELVRMLLKMGADPNLRDNTGANALLIAEMKDHSAITSLLIPVTEPGTSTAGGATALHLAASRSVSDTSLLLQRGADVNARDNRGWTPLHSAVSAGQSRIVQILLLKGADTTLENNRGETPVEMANRRGNAEIVNLLAKQEGDKHE